MGMIELGVTFSFIQLILDDIIVGHIKDIIKADYGVTKLFDPEWLDCLARKGFPPKYWSPHRVRGRSLSRVDYESLVMRPDVAVEAREKALSILSYHKPDPLPSNIRQKIRGIILEAEERKSGLQRGG